MILNAIYSFLKEHIQSLSDRIKRLFFPGLKSTRVSRTFWQQPSHAASLGTPLEPPSKYPTATFTTKYSKLARSPGKPHTKLLGQGAKTIKVKLMSEQAAEGDWGGGSEGYRENRKSWKPEKQAEIGWGWPDYDTFLVHTYINGRLLGFHWAVTSWQPQVIWRTSRFCAVLGG